jgi:hypothetical protein
MCRICGGEKSDFSALNNKIHQLRQQSTDLQKFINNAAQADKLRFSSGDEWGKPIVYKHVVPYIFKNSNPDEGILLFTLCCWLDMQVEPDTVWTTFLKRAYEGSVPGGRFPSKTKLHVQRTIETAKKYKGLSNWLAQTILAIVNEKNHNGKMNLYKFVAQACRDLYKPAGGKEIIEKLECGKLPSSFSGAQHKRFWMWMMFLRRDTSVVRCLLTRSLSQNSKGQEAISCWYNSDCFDEKACELPVDRRVFEKWNDLQLEGIAKRKNKQQVASQARSIAWQNEISPSVFDAILFLGNNS